MTSLRRFWQLPRRTSLITARGTALAFGSTPLGTKDLSVGMALLPSGNVLIDTLNGAGVPTTADKLTVVGDVRVGTTGTNGCLKNFAGTGIVGHVRVRSAVQEEHHAVWLSPESALRIAASPLLLARGGIP